MYIVVKVSGGIFKDYDTDGKIRNGGNCWEEWMEGWTGRKVKGWSLRHIEMVISAGH